MIGRTRVRCSRDGMQMLLKLGGIFKIKNGLPEDAKLVGGSYIPEYDCFDFVFETKGVPDLPECCPILIEFFPIIEKIGDNIT